MFVKEKHMQNETTKSRARALLKGHKGTATPLLLGGFALAALCGALPLLLDFAGEKVTAALPLDTSAATWGFRWGKAGAAVVLALAATLLCAPLRVGREAWYFGGADGKKRSIARVRFWLQPRWALKAMRFVVALAWRKLLWAVLYFLPGGFLLAGTLWQARGGAM
ncbi:MAG: hypothetical protein LBB50_06405, partial [Oscillospiraceae bacterium]|nr:hypothetical protein [Oscillospiraceae bacterium]